MILDLAEAKPEYFGAATTVVIVLLLNHRLYITGVGDSRAYLFEVNPSSGQPSTCRRAEWSVSEC